MTDSFGEGRATGETVKLTPAQEAARKRRGQWLALALVAFVILVFSITVARLGGSVNNVADSREWPSRNASEPPPGFTPIEPTEPAS